MHTGLYPSGPRWACDRVGERAARPAPRQRRRRAHPQRATTTTSFCMPSVARENGYHAELDASKTSLKR
jgi:hypothetical protein